MTDGEYWLNLTQEGSTGPECTTVKVYCHGMDTCSPREYITLEAPPTVNYAINDRWRAAGHPSDTCAGIDPLEYIDYGETRYNKIGVTVMHTIILNLQKK